MMTRKIGFDPTEKKSIADTYLDEFRAKNANKPTTPAATLKKPRNWFVVIFLCIWLFFWTLGIVFVASILIFGLMHILAMCFLAVWLIFAVFGWFAAVRSLRAEWRGKPILSKDTK